MNPALEARTRCVDPTARVMIEAQQVTHETVKQVKSDWAAADSTAGLTILDDGGVRLSDSIVTLIENTTSDSNITDLNRTTPFFSALIEWGDTTPNDLELQRIALYLAPRVSGAASLEVARWKIEILRLVDYAGIGAANTTNFSMAPIADPIEVAVTGEAAGLVVFDYTGLAQRPRPKAWPALIVRGAAGTPTSGVINGGTCYTVIFVYALKADGSAAGNVGWAYDSTKASVTSGGIILRGREWHSVTSAFAPGVPSLGRFYDFGSLGGTPRMRLDIGNYTNATIAFTGANKPDLGAAPSADVQLVVRGATPTGTSITAQVRNDADSGWVTFTDGQFMTADLGLTPTQTRKMQALLNTNGAANLTPTLRLLGMREVVITDLSDVATVEGGGWAVDPVELKGSIPEVTIRAIHDGDRDYRDALTELLANTDIGKLTFRVYVGDKSLQRGQWLHIDDFLIDASHPSGPDHTLTCLSPLVLLRDLLPKYEPGENVAPDGDSSVGTWTTDAGGGANLYQRIDEAAYDDTDFIQSVADPANAAYEATLGTPVDPVGRTHYVEYRYRKDVDAGKTIDLTVQLRQGTTVISQTVHTNIPGPDPGLGWQAGSFSLTDAQVAAITDYTNLRFRVSANVGGAGGSRKGQVSWARLRIGGKREAPAYVNSTLKDTYDDLLTNQLEVEARYKGPGVEDDTTTVSKNLGDVSAGSDRLIIGKREVDAIASLADGAIISSQGRLKFVDMFAEQGVVTIFDDPEIQVIDASPGYEQRVPEFFVPYRWNGTSQTFTDEVRGFNDVAIVALGNARLDPPRQLDQEISKWIDTQALAEHIADRTIRSLGLGLLLWRFRTILPYPELEPGDLIVVPTDQFVARDPNAGRTLRGMLQAIGIVAAVHDVQGTEFSVWIRGYQDIGTAPEQANRFGFDANMQRILIGSSSDFNRQGSIIPVPTDPSIFLYNTGGNAVNAMWITVNRTSTYTLYFADTTTLTLPATNTYTRPAAPTLSQVAGGVLGARTYFVRVAYVKKLPGSSGTLGSFVAYRTSTESSLAVGANNLLKVTAPEAAAYDGWIPLVGTGTNAEQAATGMQAFGADWTEPAAGVPTTGWTPYNSAWDSGLTALNLTQSTTYKLYLYFDPTVDTPVGGAYRIAGDTASVPTALSEIAASEQNGDGHYPMSFGVTISVNVPAGGGSGSGSGGGSSRYK